MLNTSTAAGSKDETSFMTNWLQTHLNLQKSYQTLHLSQTKYTIPNSKYPAPGQKRGSDSKANQWMLDSSAFVLARIRPKVKIHNLHWYFHFSWTGSDPIDLDCNAFLSLLTFFDQVLWGENAPGLFTHIGEGVVDRLKQVEKLNIAEYCIVNIAEYCVVNIAEPNITFLLKQIGRTLGYSFSLIKTSTELHGIPQVPYPQNTPFPPNATYIWDPSEEDQDLLLLLAVAHSAHAPVPNKVDIWKFSLFPHPSPPPDDADLKRDC